MKMRDPTEYDLFMRAEKERLRGLFPHYSKSLIRNMANEEWKANKGCGSGIRARRGTLKYEVNKGLIERVPQHDMTQYPDVQMVITKKECIYCTRTLRNASKKKGDHIFAVQADSDKPILSNFSAFTMPCCQDCNTSRGNKPIKEFVNSNPKYKTNEAIFDRIHSIVNEHIMMYEADQEKYDETVRYIEEVLVQIRYMTQNIPIKQVG
jgi:hypothetical protein